MTQQSPSNQKPVAKPGVAAAPAAFIQTRSGRRVEPLALRTEDIDVADIAHSLAHQCRFTGHTSAFYSVAQHCVLVSQALAAPSNSPVEGSRVAQLAGLLHDASEAYLVDLAAPLKRLPEFQAFRTIEDRIMSAIEARFGLPAGACDSADVHAADKRVLMTEALSLMAPLHPDFPRYAEPLPWRVTPLAPEQARQLFLNTFFALGGC